MATSYSSLIGVAVGDKYEIRRVLGAGGMGVVCEAVHLDLGKRVAIKLIDKSMKESELIVTRFRREARAAGQINSEHIVDVFDVGADTRVGLYIVMEYLVGEDLQGRLEREGHLDVKTAIMIAHQIARGISKAHSAGIVHRDLKPANVYLTQRDNGQMLVKLLDFGVSKLLGEDSGSSARITGHGTPIGTPLYMAPEQAEGKLDIDGRVDIWSFGALLYEALAGAPPFPDRGSYHGTLVGILTSRPKLLHDVAPWVPVEVARIVDAMLVHDRDARIADATTVAQRLLDAFPSVLPDGTGKYTAVIVPQSASTVDATGDTEVFNADPVGRTFRPQGHPRSSNRPGAQTGEPPSRRISSPRPNSYDPTPSSAAPVASGDALRTGAATPVAPGLDLLSNDTAPITKPSADAKGGGRVRRQTDPLPSSPGYGPASRRGPSVTSSGGVPASVSPPVIEPQLKTARTHPPLGVLGAPPPKRRGRGFLTLLVIVVAIAGVAVGGYVIGRRANQHRPAPRPSEPSPNLGASSSTVPAEAQDASSNGSPPPSVLSAHPSAPVATGSTHPTTSASTAEPVKKRPRPKPGPAKVDDDAKPVSPPAD